jgi:hypothetical protein
MRTAMSEPMMRDRHQRAHATTTRQTGNTLTPTIRLRKPLDDPEQLDTKPPRHFGCRLTYSVNVWHCISVSPNIT